MLRLCAFQPDIAANLGAMIRLCACLGVPLDVVSPCGFPFSVKALRRAAMDYASLADMAHHDDWAAFMAAPERRAGRLILLSTKAAVPLWNFDFQEGDTLLMGRESAGVTPEVEAAAQARILIPMAQEARSLNVVTAAAMSLGEALRQTRSQAV